MKPGLHLDRAQQIAAVRRYGESSLMPMFAAACGLVLLLALALGWHVEQETPRVLLLFVAGVSGLVGLALLVHLPQLRRAARATRTGRRVEGTLHLEVDRSDGESVKYLGTVREGNATWHLHFGNPMGWQPQAGAWPCTLVFLSDEPVPALVLLDDGLLFPTRTSRKSHGTGHGAH